MQKALGVLGGMGPLASANFITQLVENTKANEDQDHLRIYLDCNSQIPNRPAAILENGADPTLFMCESIKKLTSIGAEVIVMPCITAHAFYDKIASSATVPFLYMPEIVAKACMDNFPKGTAGVLSTVATAKLRILLNPMDSLNLPYITPEEDEQNEITRLINVVKMNGDMAQVAKDFSKVLDAMMERGASYFVLGCTELPVIAKCFTWEYMFIDTTLELAKASILACGGEVIASPKNVE